MALVKCKECETEISSKAKNCPKCGYKPKRTALFTKVILVLSIFLFYGMLTAPKTSNQPSAEYVRIDKSEKVQKNRKKIIELLMQEGIIYKIEAGGESRIYVGRQFYLMPYDDKERALTVIFHFYLAQDSTLYSMRIHDAATAKKIGRISASTGITLD